MYAVVYPYDAQSFIYIHIQMRIYVCLSQVQHITEIALPFAPCAVMRVEIIHRNVSQKPL